jgi:16S rRNA (cytidine1402-2'-O)-methyltransferase
MPKKIFLIPSPVGENDFPLPQNLAIIASLKYFFAENLKTSRRWISALRLGTSVESLHFQQLDKDTQDVRALFENVPENENIGVLSEAGCPGIADPGALAVAYAHAKGIEVVPLVGASSLFLALMSSGLNGQSFTFHGYLSVKSDERKVQLLNLAKIALKTKQTQIFIETPYRNDAFLADLVKCLPEEILLCVAKGLMSNEQFIKTQKISAWKKNMPVLGKVPAVFLIGV